MLLLCMLGCMYLFDLELLSLLDVHPAVGLLDHLVALSEQFEEPPWYFLWWLHQSWPAGCFPGIAVYCRDRRWVLEDSLPRSSCSAVLAETSVLTCVLSPDMWASIGTFK